MKKSRRDQATLALPVMSLSPAARYALSAATALAHRRPGELCDVEGIVAGRGLPRSFVAKLMRKMAQRGIVVSRRGPRGGHALARPAEEISLAEVVEAVEPPAARHRQCLMELRGCDADAPCAIHDSVVRAEREVWDVLRATTLGRYARGDRRNAS
jgi:Rrf2 family iron-sulfur cluster assembly transcriptional regulator